MLRLPWRRRRAPSPPLPPAERVSKPAVSTPPDFTELEAQARYQRDRLGLYRAKLQGSDPAATARLRELERASAGADERLRTARRRRPGSARSGGGTGSPRPAANRASAAAGMTGTPRACPTA